MKEYLFCYWEIDPVTMLRKAYHKKEILAENIIQATKQFKYFRHLDLVEYLKCGNDYYHVRELKDGSFVFDPFPYKTKSML